MNERERCELEAWVIAAAGAETTRRFEAPVAISDQGRRPWVVVRPLTARETLQREALGLREEMEIGPDGAVRAIRRSYDLEAMVSFDLERCVVDFRLPMMNDDGEVRWVGGDAEMDAQALLDRLPAKLMSWLMECVDAVNMRRPEDAEVLAATKKA